MLRKLKMKFKKPKDVLILEIIEEACTGCGQCAARCKRKVFEMDETRKIATVKNIDYCLGCGKCVEKMCGFNAIKLITT